MKNLILASTSTTYGGNYLDYLLPHLDEHFKKIETILFIPFARPGGMTHDDYTSRVQDTFNLIDIEVKGLHEYDNAQKAIKNAQGIFTGGGNTFLLVSMLYKLELMPVLREMLYAGTPYLGTSAGSNIGGVTMQNTNDMPIIYPPSFKTLGAVPFNINAHYIDPDEGSTHMGETRETRIREFHHFNTIPVVGLREGSWIEVNGPTSQLKGELTARIFEAGKKPWELEPEEFIDFS
ncbi:MAG: dipeptidase PepE [Leeuwenhoekiella sp.]